MKLTMKSANSLINYEDIIEDFISRNTRLIMVLVEHYVSTL